MTRRHSPGRGTVVAFALLATLLAGASVAVAPAVAATAGASTASTVAQTDGEPVPEFTISIEDVPDEDYTVLVDVTLENPEVLDDPDVETVRVQTNEVSIDVVDEGDFSETDEYARWAPDPDADAPTMTLRVSGEDALKSHETYADSYEELRLSRMRPSVYVNGDLVRAGDAGIEFNHELVSEGYVHAGDAAGRVVVGPHTLHTATTDHAPLTLVEPDGVEYGEDPETIVTAFDEVSAAHDVESQREQVSAIAAPYDGRCGRAIGDWFWACQDSAVDDPDSTWLHEFIHTTEQFDFDTSALWINEAYATYYTALYSLELTHDADSEVFEETQHSEFESRLDIGSSYQANLSDRSDWKDSSANYYQGSLVLGALDREIRLSTDGEVTLADVLDELHGQEDVTHDDFVETIWVMTDYDHTLAVNAENWITGEETPDTWNASEHEAAFGYDPTFDDPVAEISAPDSTCLNCNFEVAASNENDHDQVSYEWEMDDGTSYSGWENAHAYESAGEYEVTLTVTHDVTGATDTDTHTVVVEDDEPHGEIVPSTTSADVGESVGFDVETNTDWITDRQWDMGDGTTHSGDWHVSHSYDEPGTYTVSLETESGYDGSRTTDTVTIEVS